MAGWDRVDDAGEGLVTGFLPPAALRDRLGDLHALAVDGITDEQEPLIRDSPDELAALDHAIAATGGTKCVDDVRFTTDRPAALTPADLSEMRAMCASCRVRPQCGAYAAAAEPPVGFWAGRQYPRPKDTTPA